MSNSYQEAIKEVSRAGNLHEFICCPFRLIPRLPQHHDKQGVALFVMVRVAMHLLLHDEKWGALRFQE
jgi:hypothetical protein